MKFGHTTISNVHVNKVLLVTFVICCCAIIRNIFINFYTVMNMDIIDLFGRKKAIRQNNNFLLLLKY